MRNDRALEPSPSASASTLAIPKDNQRELLLRPPQNGPGEEPRGRLACREALALAEAGAHLAEAADPLLDRRVGREESGHALAREGLDDVEGLGRLVDLHRHRCGALLETQQRARQGLRVAAGFGATGVGCVLGLARDRELDDARRD